MATTSVDARIERALRETEREIYDDEWEAIMVIVGVVVSLIALTLTTISIILSQRLGTETRAHREKVAQRTMALLTAIDAKVNQVDERVERINRRLTRASGV